MILTGRCVALIGLGAIATVVTRNLWVMVGWTGIVLVVAVLDWLLLPHAFQARRAPLAPLRLSQTTHHEIRFVNTSTRHMRGEVRDAWQPSAGARAGRHRIDLPPGEAAVLRTALTPRRRGQLEAYWLVLRTRSALGLAWRQSTQAHPATLRVLPEFRARRHLPSRLVRLRELDGQAAVLVRGEGTEFDSLREYVEGDDVRSIDWRATARRRDLVVRTWRPERDRRVLIMLDTSRLAAARLDEETRLDAGIETTLLMAALADHAGDRVEMLAADRRIRARVSENRGEATMSALADALGPLEPELTEPDWPLITRTITGHLSGKALIVLCTAIDPGALGSGLITAARTLAQRHEVLIASASDPIEAALGRRRESSEDVFIAAAAARAEADRRQLEELLTSAGVHVVQATPAELAPAVADRYLELKAAGRL